MASTRRTRGKGRYIRGFGPRSEDVSVRSIRSRFDCPNCGHVLTVSSRGPRSYRITPNRPLHDNDEQWFIMRGVNVYFTRNYVIDYVKANKPFRPVRKWFTHIADTNIGATWLVNGMLDEKYGLGVDRKWVVNTADATRVLTKLGFDVLQNPAV